MRSFLYKVLPVFLCLALLLCARNVSGQVTIRGTVYNMYRTRPLDAVSVVSTSGRGTTTDSNGNYSIIVNLTDSIYFSYLGRSTQKFAVSEINRFAGFDIALHVNPTELNEVRVAPRNYHMDSLRNREEYEKVFDYKKPGFSLTSPNSGLGVGVDLDALINMFKFRQTRRMLAFQRRLEEEEQDKFIDHRFNRSIVKKITHLDDDEIDSFMVKFRPSYEFTKSSTDYVFYDYIKLAAKEFRAIKIRDLELKKD
ncbi:MAG TPA: carboxypeptidase-like regulatory domain-containing protein [Puia sp.]|nr:carboxypeptidase-like regulatory domain-containing protein [Puia sp.]